MEPVGSTPPVPALMRRAPDPLRRRRSVRKVHLKYVGITPKTLERYRRALQGFFRHLRRYGIPLPRTMGEFDEAVAEYINEMWLEDEPHGYANDLISGISRLLPRARRHIPTSRMYIRNWGTTLARKRACPLPRELVLAMAGAAFLRRRPDVAAVLLVGFAGLLRTAEMVSLKREQLLLLMRRGQKAVAISLVDTKTAKRKAAPEQISGADSSF